MSINISNNNTVADNISVLGEIDIFNFTMVRGVTYEFETILAGLRDSVISLYDANGTWLTSDDDSGNGLASLITFTPLISGNYALAVGGYGGNYTGAYYLSMTGEEPENVLPALTGTSYSFPTLAAGSIVVISETQLLEGWSDENLDSLSVTNLNASSGVLVNNNNGTWTFTAPASGQSTLTYGVYDGTGATTAQNSIATAAVVTPAITVTKLGSGHTVEDGGTAGISVALNAAIPVGASFTVTLTSNDISEAGFMTNGVLGATKTFTFNSGNWSSAQVATLTGVQDYDNDGDTGYTVTVRAAQNALNPASSYATAIRNLNTTLNMVNDGDISGTGQDRDVPVYLIGDEGRPQMDNLVGNDGADRLYGGYMVDDLRGGIGNDRLYGGYEDDFLYGDSGNDMLYGEQDDDFLSGGAGNDRLDGGIGADTMVGGAGNDVYYVTLNDDGGVEDTLDESAESFGNGTDTVYIPFQVESYVAPVGIEIVRMNAGFGDTNVTGNASNNGLYGNAGDNMLDGGTGNDTLAGGSGDDDLIGGAGTDSLSGGVGADDIAGGTGADRLSGGAGSDDLDGGSSADVLNGGTGNDTLAGGTENDSLIGDTGNDTLSGGSGNDTLSGGSNNDRLIGDTGNDLLAGGSGTDLLAGGAGSDVFDWNALTETTTSTTGCDRITDFVHLQDDIDLSTLDANVGAAGNQAFRFISSASFSAAGQIRFANGFLYGSTDADSSAEFVIQIQFVGAATLSSGDFIL
jgi:Ca2+-binding RTX toxin-like protein